MTNMVTNIMTNMNCEPDGQELLLCTFHILTKKPLLLLGSSDQTGICKRWTWCVTI